MTSPRLALSGDLQIEVDGTAGTVRARDGRIRVDLAEPLVAARAVTGTYGGRPGLSRWASGLAASGVTVEVHGPRGLLGTIGAGVDSRLGSAVAGSRRVSARPAALQTLVPPGVRRAALVGVPVLVLLAALARRR